MTSIKAGFVHSPELEMYRYPPECPFKAARAGKTRRILVSMGMLSGPGRVEVAPAPAAMDIVTGFHSERYIEVLRRAERGEMDMLGLEMGLGTPDTPVFVGMTDYALLAAGATLTAAELVATGQVHVAFNPSGGYHHAHAERASGFCYVNDVVLACQALAARGMRVVFLDVDAHHCDGVQGAFYDRADVMTVSLHESGRTLFPGTGFEGDVGVGAGEGYSVNVPLPAGCYDEAFATAYREAAEPLISAFEPDVIVLELGMDGLAGDPLAHLSLTNNAYADLIGRVRALGKPIVAVGGGGYHVANTARGWALAWSILCGEDAFDAEMIGMGGVMLESVEWRGGLRDRVLAVAPAQRDAVAPAVAATIAAVREKLFGFHGLE